MTWGPEGRPALEARTAGELTTAELGACMEYAQLELARGDLEPRRRPVLQEWLRELLAERDQRAVMAAEAKERIMAARAAGRQS